MEKFTLVFKMDNAAFGVDWDTESARILEKIAARIRSGDSYGNIMDINGNRVGKWEAR